LIRRLKMLHRTRITFATVALLFLPLVQSQGQDFMSGDGKIAQMEKQGASVLHTIIKIVKNYILPLIAIIAMLYGLVHGMKDGRWDTAILCFAAALVLAIMPSVLGALGFEALK